MPTLNWIGKDAVVNHHKQVPFRLLKPVDKLSVLPSRAERSRSDSGGEVEAEGTGNLLIQGDNLEALKALLPYYAGQVKCIYIDPPYNTGNEGWVYNDNVNSPEMKAWLGKVVGGEAEDLSRHDKWLCMMYPRLILLRVLLTEDGVIFISIDDNEIANLQLVTKEIFGKENIVATLVWEKGKKGDPSFFSVTHEYILVAAKNKNLLSSKNTKWRRRKDGIDEVLTYYDNLRREFKGKHDLVRKKIIEWFRALPKNHPAKAHKHYNWSDDRGLYFPDNFHGPDDGRENRPRYDIIHPITGKPCKKPSTGWRWDEEHTKQALAENPPRIHFGLDEKTIPCRKSYLFEVNEEPYPSVFYKDGRAATLQVEQILGAGAFSFPKDVTILAELIKLVSSDSDLILDSFGGTGTTGEAVLMSNKSDGGNRKFILVEMDKDICQKITSVRLQKVINGYSPLTEKDNKEKVIGYGGGFRYCELGATLFDADGQIREEVKYNDLAQHVYFIETGQPLPTPPPFPKGKGAKAAKGKSQFPLLGIHNDIAVYLLYNGILKDKKPNGGNVLTRAILKSLPKHAGTKIIYGTGCLLSEEKLRELGITFRQIPYEVKSS